MTAATPLWRHAANGAALVAILSVASLILHSTPSQEWQQSPISVPAAMNETATGRNVRATVHAVTVAKAVTAGNGWAGTTPGVWVVVDLSVEAVVDDQGAALGTAVLRVGETSFNASTRPDRGTLAAVRLATGIPLTGPIMFELPADVASSASAETATLELATNSDPRVDSLIVVPVDLGDAIVRDTLDVDFPEWGTR
jgi:hypothetical protein